MMYIKFYIQNSTLVKIQIDLSIYPDGISLTYNF